LKSTVTIDLRDARTRILVLDDITPLRQLIQSLQRGDGVVQTADGALRLHLPD